MVDPDQADQMDAIIERYGEVQARFEELDGYALDARAREVLAEHETAYRQVTGHLSPGAYPLPAQLTIFTPLSQPVLERLREVDLNRLTPIEALNLLAELKKQIE